MDCKKFVGYPYLNVEVKQVLAGRDLAKLTIIIRILVVLRILICELAGGRSGARDAMAQRVRAAEWRIALERR
jgi:hypothetical protein